MRFLNQVPHIGKLSYADNKPTNMINIMHDVNTNNKAIADESINWRVVQILSHNEDSSIRFLAVVQWFLLITDQPTWSISRATVMTCNEDISIRFLASVQWPLLTIDQPTWYSSLTGGGIFVEGHFGHPGQFQAFIKGAPPWPYCLVKIIKMIFAKVR